MNQDQNQIQEQEKLINNQVYGYPVLPAQGLPKVEQVTNTKQKEGYEPTPGFGLSPQLPQGTQYFKGFQQDAPKQVDMFEQEQQFMVVPHHFKCQFCGHEGNSVYETQTNPLAYVAAGLTCLVCWPLFWVPFALRGSKDLVHYCCNCKNEIYRHRL